MNRMANLGSTDGFKKTVPSIRAEDSLPKNSEKDSTTSDGDDSKDVAAMHDDSKIIHTPDDDSRTSTNTPDDDPNKEDIASIPTSPKTPSKVWYLAHVLMWVVSGFVCYLIWKDENPQAAKKHLMHSLWLPLLFVPVALFLFTLIPDI